MILRFPINALSSWLGAKQILESAAEFVEPGASATDDRRPVFQQMIERACDGEHAFDVIAVHSYSRFFRDAFGQEFYLRKLAKHGYRLIEVEKRGTKVKKTLAVDPVDAETVRLIFKLYLHGDGTSGALGVKEVVKWLDSRGYRTRKGKTFGVGTIYKLLTNTTYKGEWKFNRMSSRTGKWKPDEEVVTSTVPAIIEPHMFEDVQRQLHARSPKVAAPRVTTGPILLTGLAVCATCNGGMTLRTGTSKTGAIHRYYACSTCARKGKTVCKGRSIPMAKLDVVPAQWRHGNRGGLQGFLWTCC